MPKNGGTAAHTVAMTMAQRIGAGLGGFPNPDDPFEPRGPGGPVMSSVLIAALDRMAQVGKGQPQPWRDAAGKPQPDPWRDAFAVALGHSLAAEAIRLTALGHALGGDTGKKVEAHATGVINAYVDDICGTPPRWRWPFPPRFDGRFTDQELLLLAGQLAAGGKLGDVAALTAAADRVATKALR